MVNTKQPIVKKPHHLHNELFFAIKARYKYINFLTGNLNRKQGNDKKKAKEK